MLKAQQRRADVAALRAFREAVWAREGLARDWTGASGAWCQRCRVRVYRDWPPFGEVHHIMPRSRSRAGRYDPANGQLLCRACHRAVQEHRA